MSHYLTPERRSVPIELGTVEYRAGKQFGGLASIYYDGTPRTEFQLTPSIVERVHAGAFDDVLASSDDVFGLYNHEEGMMLGRRSSGTLKIESRSDGLAYSVPYDAEDPIHQTVARRIARKDVRGSSVTWYVEESGQDFERRNDGMIVRNIRKVARMIDVGPTHIPAYSATSAEMRSGRAPESLLQIEAAARAALRDPPTPAEFWPYIVSNSASVERWA